jgi:N-acetyl-gamma-glutamyl-phosphate reductase
MSAMKKIRAGIIGASGYTGQELVRLLLQHPDAQIAAVTSQNYAGKSFADVFPAFTGQIDLKFESSDGLKDIVTRCDVLFFALPHMVAGEMITDELLEKVKVIDLSADFRLKEPSQYDTWYHMVHPRPKLLSKAVYGLPEWRREEIVGARLVANPGCYATCSILSLLPLAEAKLLQEPIIIDAKSGVSGAGRAADIAIAYSECNESIKAYKVAEHRHIPEIEQELSAVASVPLKLTFTPHLVPMSRGILATVYCRLDPNLSVKGLYDIYDAKYGKEPFVRTLRSAMPETRWVKGSNFCQIGMTTDKRTGQTIIVGVIDNLIKGASGQAVQNLNLMFGLPETAGLAQLAALP